MAPLLARADALAQIAACVGQVWRRTRRFVPLEVEEHLLDVLLSVQRELMPGAASLADNVKGARSQVKTMLDKLALVADRSANHAMLRSCDRMQTASGSVPEVNACSLPCLQVEPPAGGSLEELQSELQARVVPLSSLPRALQKLCPPPPPPPPDLVSELAAVHGVTSFLPPVRSLSAVAPVFVPGMVARVTLADVSSLTTIAPTLLTTQPGAIWHAQGMHLGASCFACQAWLPYDLGTSGMCAHCRSSLSSSQVVASAAAIEPLQPGPAFAMKKYSFRHTPWFGVEFSMKRYCFKSCGDDELIADTFSDSSISEATVMQANRVIVVNADGSSTYLERCDLQEGSVSGADTPLSDHSGDDEIPIGEIDATASLIDVCGRPLLMKRYCFTASLPSNTELKMRISLLLVGRDLSAFTLGALRTELECQLRLPPGSLNKRKAMIQDAASAIMACSSPSK